MINAARNFVKWLQDYVVDLPDDLIEQYEDDHLRFRSAVDAYDTAYHEDCLLDLVDATREILHWYGDILPVGFHARYRDAYMQDYLALKAALRHVTASV